MSERLYHGKPVSFWRGLTKTKKRISEALGDAITEATIRKLEEQESIHPLIAETFLETLERAVGRPINRFGCIVLHFRDGSKKVEIALGCEFDFPEDVKPGDSEKTRVKQLMKQFLAREKLHPIWVEQISERFDKNIISLPALWLLKFEIKLPFVPHKVALQSYGDWEQLRGKLFYQELPENIQPSWIKSEKGVWVTPEQATQMIEQFAQQDATMTLISPTFE